MARKAKRSGWQRALVGTVYVAFCAVVLALGTIGGWISQSKVASAVTSQTLRNVPPRQVFGDHDALTLLILGCDENRTPGGKKVTETAARSDMMLLTRIDFVTNQVTGLSIPRDILLGLSGYRRQRINAYHAIGGKDLTKRAVEALLGIPVDRVAVVNYDAFQRMVDMVGGVDVFVEKRMKWTDRAGALFIDLKPGRQILDGYNAMCFVRFRHSDSDFARQERQKEFLLSFKDTVMAKPQLLNQLADQTVDLLGGELTPDEVAALARFARGVANENVRMGVVPVTELKNYDLQVDERKLPETLAEFDFAPKHYTSRLANH